MGILLAETLTALMCRTQNASMLARTQSDVAGPTSPEARSAGVRRALLIVLLLNTLSAALKVGVGARTGALTVLGAALESGLDILSNGVAILAVSIAARAPDDDHPYGHEKFETLGTLGIVAFLAITCFELMRQSILELTGQHAAPTATVVDGVMLVGSLGANAFVVLYERRRGRALGSALLLADAAHTASDILVTALAIASLVLSHLGYLRADALLGMLVALIIAWSGYQILRDSIPILVDARAVEADRLASIVRTIPGVIGVRSARSRRTASGHLFAEVTILVDGATSVSNAHAFTDEVERAIARELGTAEAIVHVEPA
jgi:cation diffusion facilitator family transporter